MIAILHIPARPLVAIVVAAFVLLLANVAGAKDNCGSIDRVIVAFRLAHTLYPELKGKELSLTLAEGHGGSTGGPAMALALFIKVDKPFLKATNAGQGQASEVTTRQNADAELPLSFHYNFIDLASGGDVVCRPVQFIKDMDSKQMAEARAAINAHPEWTDAEDLEAAGKYNLRFGPDNKIGLLRTLPLGQLNMFYAPLRIERVRFSVTGVKQAGSSFADLRWYIDAREVGTPRELEITVDPFIGRIDGISESRKQ
jgi:hypothetical protein